MYPPEVSGTRAFFEGNRFLSRAWGVIFVVAILMSTAGTTPLVLLVLPNALVIVVLVFGPEIDHWYGSRFAPSRTVQEGHGT
jgi:hypothetical protein